MESYNFWQDFFDTYQSLSDWMKMLWLIVPPVFVLSLIALVMRMRIDLKQADHGFTGKLIYSIHRDEKDQFHITAHGRVSVASQPFHCISSSFYGDVSPGLDWLPCFMR